jgi:lipoprotein-anchoring transpeptidase ErfK/SrfK
MTDEDMKMKTTDRQWMKLAGLMVLAVVQARAEWESGRRIVVSIPDRKLALIVDGQVVKVYETAVGKASTPSPSGEFSVVHRIPHPTWYGHKIPVPPGKSNPLGTRWIGLSAKGYGIHGTNAPKSIGSAASGGCIRMRNQDVEELFELVKMGDVVELHHDRNERIAQLFAPPAGAVTVAAE